MEVEMAGTMTESELQESYQINRRPSSSGEPHLADADSDGVLTSNQHDWSGLGRYGVTFTDFDLNGDDLVTWQEHKGIFKLYHGTPGERSAWSVIWRSCIPAHSVALPQ